MVKKKKGSGAKWDNNNHAARSSGFTAEETRALKSSARKLAKRDEHKKTAKLTKKVAKKLKKGLSSSSSSSSDSDSDSSDSSDDSYEYKKKKKGKKKAKKKKKSAARKAKDKAKEALEERDALQSELELLKKSVVEAAKPSTDVPNNGETLPESVVTMTLDEFREMEKKAHDASHPNTPVKPPNGGLFNLSAPTTSTASSASEKTLGRLSELLVTCDDSTPLKDGHGSKDISDTNSALAKSLALKCHQKYFYAPDTLKNLQMMIQKTDLQTRATRGPALLTAIIKAALSRGINCTAEDLGLEAKDLK